MTATAVAEKPTAPPRIPLDHTRVGQAEHVLGPVLHVTLPKTGTIEAGDQDVAFWRNVREPLTTDQLLIVSNDARTMWRLMRIERVVGNRSSGLAHV